MFGWHRGRQVKDEKRCPWEGSGWSRIRSRAAGVATKMHANPRALKEESVNSNTMQEMQESSAQPGSCCFPSHLQMQQLLGSSKHQWTSGEGGGDQRYLPRRSFWRQQDAHINHMIETTRRCLYLDTRKSHQPQAGAKSSSSGPLPSTSAPIHRKPRTAHSLHTVPSPHHHQGSNNSVSMYFNVFVANVILAAKVILTAMSVQSMYSPRQAHFYLNYY